MIKTRGYAAHHSFSSLKPFDFEREEPKPNEIEMQVLFCGVCHSDIHQVANDWKNTVYPCVPGHEVVGRVTKLGNDVKRHKIGDLVGVGCMIDSCRHCAPCVAGEENYCEGPNSWLATYNGPMVPAAKAPTETNMYDRDNTFGGYSTTLVVPEDFALKIPAGLKPEVAAPILCAGVTTYSPMKHWGVKAGQRVGVVGFGGLGHMAAQLANALGADVTLLTTTEEKLKEAKLFGADAVLSTDAEAMQALAMQFDFVIDTIPEPHDPNPFVGLVKHDGALVIVGALGALKSPTNNQEVAFHRRSLGGSLIGSLAETQEVLDFCAQHGIGPQIEVIPIQQINDAFKRVLDGDVRYRYVIDMESLRAQAA